jgi:hypothetical protein
MRSTVLVDPIVLLFGKDIAQLIYQRLFKDINEQYRDIVYLCKDNGAVLMISAIGILCLITGRLGHIINTFIF